MSSSKTELARLCEARYFGLCLHGEIAAGRLPVSIQPDLPARSAIMTVSQSPA